MNKIEIENKVHFIPSSWEEMTVKQLHYLVGLYSRKLTDFEFRTLLIIYFLGWRRKVIAYKDKMYWIPKYFRYFPLRSFVPFLITKGKCKVIDNVDLYLLIETLDFVNKETPVLHKNKIPVIKVGRFFKTKLFGPADDFSNCSYLEYAKTDVRFMKFFASESKDVDALNELIAVIYRPKKWFLFFRKKFGNYNGDIRRKYNDTFVNRYKNKINRLPWQTKYTIFLFVYGVRKQIEADYPHIFQKSEESKTNNFGHAGIIVELAGAKFGNPDQTAETPLHTIMIHLEQLSIDAEEARERNNLNTEE